MFGGICLCNHQVPDCFFFFFFGSLRSHFLFCFVFLGPQLWHMELPIWQGGLYHSYSCHPTPQPQLSQIWATCANYITAHSNARSLAHWERPGIKPASSWILVKFVSTETRQELLNPIFNFSTCDWPVQVFNFLQFGLVRLYLCNNLSLPSRLSILLAYSYL